MDTRDCTKYAWSTDYFAIQRRISKGSLKIKIKLFSFNSNAQVYYSWVLNILNQKPVLLSSHFSVSLFWVSFVMHSIQYTYPSRHKPKGKCKYGKALIVISYNFKRIPSSSPEEVERKRVKFVFVNVMRWQNHQHT